MSWLHRQLLRTLPQAHRDRYGADIERVFDEQRASARWRERPGLWMREGRAVVAIAMRHRSPRVTSVTGVRAGQRCAGWRQDLQHATRNVLRAPGHAATVVLCLGVGIAITLSAFSVLNGLVYGQLPGVSDRDTLSRVYVRESLRGGTVNVARFPPDQFQMLHEHGPAIVAIAGQSDRTFAVRVHGEMISVPGAFVSGEYFNTLGTRPVLGRVLVEPDEQYATDAALIGERFWHTHFGGTPGVLGQVIAVAGRDVQIVGVIPTGFVGFDLMGIMEDFEAPQLWLPLSLAQGWPGLGPREPLISVAVRHAPGVTREAAEADLAVAVARLPVLARQQHGPNLRPLGQGPEDSGGDVAAAFFACLSAPLALLLIGCANVANLQLARSLDRARELAVRLSLGASRGRVMRLISLEAALLASGAVAFAWFCARLLLGYLSLLMPLPIHADWRVFGVAAGLAVIVTLGCGVVPGWLVASRLQLGALKQTPQSGARPHARLRHALVGVQVAISLTLLIVSGLMGRTLASMTARIPPVAREVLVANVNVEQSGLDEHAVARLADALADDLARDGRVRAVGVSSDADLFARDEWRYLRSRDDRSARQFARVQRVTPGYFPAAAMPALAGRTLTRADAGTPAAVVNATLARAIEHDGGPTVGRQLRLERLHWMANEQRPAPLPIEIVGVVPDAPRRPSRPTPDCEIYLPLGGTLPPAFTLYARADSPSALAPSIRRALDRLEPRAARVEAATAFDRIRKEASPFVYLAASAGTIGALALLLAVAGLYAVVAYVVSLRTREFGVRLAVGARPADIARLVINQAARIVGIGALAGLLITVPIVLALQRVFVGVSPLDPWAFLPMFGALAAAAAIASLMPARRAARIDPVAALRAE